MYLLELILMENPQYMKMGRLVAETCSMPQCPCRQHPLLSMCHIQGISLQLLWLRWACSVAEHPCCHAAASGRSTFSLDGRNLTWEHVHWQYKVYIKHKQRTPIQLWQLIEWRYNCWSTELGILIYLREDDLYISPAQPLDGCLSVSLGASLRKYQTGHLQNHL